MCVCVCLHAYKHNITRTNLLLITLSHYVSRGSALYYSSVYAWFSLVCDLTFKFWKYFALYRASCNFHSGISANTRVFVLIQSISSFCTFILLRYFVVSSSLFFPYLIHPVECCFQKVHQVFLSLSQSWSTANSMLLSLRSSRNTSHPWPIHKRVTSWKIPELFFLLQTVLLISPVSVAFHAALKERDFLHAWSLTISLKYRMFLGPGVA